VERRGWFLAVAVCVTLLPAGALATSVSGTLAVTATVSGSMSMVFSTDVSGITLGGSGTSSATIAFGSVQAYGGILKPSIPCR
jgi:hypothetical protein